MIEQQKRVFFLLCVLYYLQGIPFGIQLRSLPLYFYDVLGYPIETVTNLNLLMLPWIFLKPLFICFVDIRQYCSEILLSCLISNVVLNLLLFVVFATPGFFNMTSMIILFFLVNCFTVILDIATDQLIIASATSVTDIKFFGISNAIQIVGYKFGASFSGMLVYFISYNRIFVIFLCACAMYCFAIYLVRTTFKKFLARTNLNNKADSSRRISFRDVVRETLSTKCDKLFLLYIVTYKLGESGAIFLLPLYLLEFGTNRNDVLFLTTAVCDPCSLIGSLIGGVMWTCFKGGPNSLVNILILVSLLRLLPLLLQYYLICNLKTMQKFAYIVFSISMPSLCFFAGLLTAFVTILMMMVTSLAGQSTYAGYCYAIVSSCETFGRVAFSSQAGYLSRYFGKQNVFAIFNILVFSSTVFIILFKPLLLREIRKGEDKKR